MSISRKALVSAAIAALIGTMGTAAQPHPAQAADSSVTYPAPGRDTGDLTGDGKIDEDDISRLLAAVGTEQSAPTWSSFSAADYDADGRISMSDVTAMSQRYVYDSDPFEILEASIVEIQAAMTAGTLTSEALTRMYLDRIGTYDDNRTLHSSGNALNSILALDQEVLNEARSLDQERSTSGPRSILHGVPVVVKDNINTYDMPTTAGCGCLAGNQTGSDARTVALLRAAGAVIIAKTNMSEFAFANLSSISWLGGTTRNPYNLGRSPGGSSGGTAAAVAANLASFGLGTDTGGSIRVPSAWNALVGIRPTYGLVSREGVIPFIGARDTVGPMTRTVSDAALALDALAGTDPQDATTAGADAHIPASYATSLDDRSLEGARIGYLAGLSGTTNGAVNQLTARALDSLREQGATVIALPAMSGLGAITGNNSFRVEMNQYLSAYVRPGYTLTDLIAVAEGPLAASSDDKSTQTTWLQNQNAVTQAEYETWSSLFQQVQQDTRDAVDAYLETYDLDAIVYSTTESPTSTAALANRISAFTGYPAITVPMGFAATEQQPLGLEFLAGAYSEPLLIGFAYDYEQATHHRFSYTGLSMPYLFPDIAG